MAEGHYTSCRVTVSTKSTVREVIGLLTLMFLIRFKCMNLSTKASASLESKRESLSMIFRQ